MLYSMFARTVHQFCQITDSRISGELPSDAIINNVVIDSRRARKDTLFFALQGARTHGIRFADAARAAGAIVVADEQSAGDDSGPLIVAGDAGQALQQLAHVNRRQSDTLVAGVTGSVGKTTTRRLLASVLSSVRRGIQSPSSYNNELGVPLSLLQIQDDTEFAVIEMGARHPGDIGHLCRIALPDLAVVTCVAPSHLTSFGSVAGIAATKRELVDSLGTSGTAFLNADDPCVLAMADSAHCQVITCGRSSNADRPFEVVDVSNTQLAVRMGRHTFSVPICGEHHATGLALSIAVAQELGLSSDEIQMGLDEFEPAPGRAVLRTIDGIEVIDDTYNASPVSVRAAIMMLNSWRTRGRRVLVLGDMLELGEQAEDLHIETGATIFGTEINHTLVCGRHAAHVAEGFLSTGGSPGRISVFDSVSSLLSVLDRLVDSGDVLLVKGSRGMAMERIVSGLRRSSAPHEQRAV